MKQYRLIKCYPGSPELRTEIFNNEIFKGHYYYKLKNHHKVDLGTLEPWKYPEFWQEVVEKDYEIINIFPLNKMNGLPYVCSVKRLSDGEIFSIGDEVNNEIINRFYIQDNYLRAFFERKNCLDISEKLQFLKHTKTPLFITEDGVDIYEGDKIYSIESSLNEINEKIAGIYKHSTHNHPVEHWYNDDKYFSTKKAAEEYIILNKPCLSINDVNSILFKTKVGNKRQSLLKELVKSKL